MIDYSDFQRRPLQPLAAPDDRPVLHRTDETTIFWSVLADEVRHDCSGCGEPLALGWMPPHLVGTVLECSNCKALNEVE
jgi:hypothetical protein